MSEAYFAALGPGRYRPGDATRGPWSADLMHGGPASALLAHEVLRAAEGGDGPDPALLARVTVEILAPLPVADLAIEVRWERRGRRVALLAGMLSIGAKPAALVRAWLVRTTDLENLPPPPGASPGPGEPVRIIPPGWSGSYLDSIDWSWVNGSLGEPGPGTVWADPRLPLVAGRSTSGPERALIVADSGNGVSSVLDLRRWLFINTELTLHLFRMPGSGALWLDAETTVDPCGVGLASTSLGDTHGLFGRAAQTLFVARRDR